jgi:hypothetical protein
MEKMSYLEMFLFLSFGLAVVVATRDTFDSEIPFYIKSYTPIASWSVFQANVWNSLPSTLNNSYKSQSNIFPYYDTGIANSLPNFPTEFEFENVSINHFVQSNTSNNIPSYYYYSGNIMNEEFDLFRTQIDSSDVFTNISALNNLVGNIWISSQDVHATLHYDSVYNLFIQLSGRKKMILHPPKDIVSSFIYGRNHPFACQSRWMNAAQETPYHSRIPYSMKNLSSFTTFPEKGCKPASLNNFLEENRNNSWSTEPQIVEIILSPGDILFIPPFWLHEVKFLFISCSCSLFQFFFLYNKEYCTGSFRFFVVLVGKRMAFHVGW